MRLIIVFFVLLFSIPICYAQKFKSSGLASFYAKKFHGRKTANGERFNMHSYTSAHRTLPFNSLVKVTNTKNGKSIVVRVNDRGPMRKNRIIDLSYAAAEELSLVNDGIGRVTLELLDPAEARSYMVNNKLLKECCFAEVEDFQPITSYNLSIVASDPYGHSIQEKKSDCIFSQEYVNDSLCKIKITPIFNSMAMADVSKSKSRRKNRANEY
jgi:rare lipoprotein A